jgi:hypothetical protein
MACKGQKKAAKQLATAVEEAQRRDAAWLTAGGTRDLGFVAASRVYRQNL